MCVSVIVIEMQRISNFTLLLLLLIASNNINVEIRDDFWRISYFCFEI